MEERLNRLKCYSQRTHALRTFHGCVFRHTPQLGRVGVFGGSKDYTGAPFYASISSLRMGADLAYVFTAQEAAPAIKTYSPELMVRRLVWCSPCQCLSLIVLS